MADSFSVSVRGTEAVLARLRQADAAQMARIKDALDEGGYEMAEHARQLCPVGEGATRDSIDYRVLAGASNTLLELYATAPQAVYVHEGTRPHFPPLAAIAGWAARHGVTAWIAARGVAAHGTKPHPFLRDAVTRRARSLLSRLAAPLSF